MKKMSWRLGCALVAASAMGVATLPAAGPDAASTVPANPTFTKDIQPIFQQACEACHRPGQMAPFSVQSYEDVRPWARSIKQKTESRYMPPWHLDRTVGAFVDLRRATRARPLATAETFIAHLQKPVVDELVEVITRGGATQPRGLCRVIPADPARLGHDETKQRPADRRRCHSSRRLSRIGKRNNNGRKQK